MSEFTCWKGHIMPSGALICPECGGRLTYMDGMSASQYAKMEADEARWIWEKNCDEEDSDEREEYCEANDSDQ